MAHVSDLKKQTVEKLKELLIKYPIVGAVNMENLPGPQLQTMRELLRGKVEIFMAKRRLIKIAFDEVKGNKPGIEKLLEYMRIGMPALMFTNENPFKIFKTIEKNKSPAPAKAGQIAPKDIEIKAGLTPFMPGPVIGELGAIGIKSGVENGKVAIKNDTVVCKAGQEIKANVAAMLTRLNILPMEIGLDVPAIFEEGVIYTRDVLSVDEDKYINDITNAARWAFNLSMEVGIVIKDNVNTFVTKAFNDAKSLAIECGILSKDTVGLVLGKAHSLGQALKAKLEE